jgi:hypothetical protein
VKGALFLRGSQMAVFQSLMLMLLIGCLHMGLASGHYLALLGCVGIVGDGPIVCCFQAPPRRL